MQSRSGIWHEDSARPVVGRYRRAFRAPVVLLSLLSLAGCTEPAATPPPTSSAEAPAAAGSAVADERQILSGRYKSYKRNFALVTRSGGKANIGLFASEDRSKPRLTHAQLAETGRQMCRARGHPAGNVTVSDAVSEQNKSILTFIKCG